MQDLYTQHNLDREVVQKWFAENYPGFPFEETGAAQLYLQQVANIQPDLSGYVTHEITPMNKFGPGQWGNVKVVLTGLIERTLFKRNICPLESCWKRVTFSNELHRDWKCPIHGDITGYGEPPEIFTMDMVGTDFSVKPMRFAFGPWATDGAIKKGLIRGVENLVNRPVLLRVQFKEGAFRVSEILGFKGAAGNSDPHQQTLDVTTPKPPEQTVPTQPVQQPAPQPAVPTVSSGTAAPSIQKPLMPIPSGLVTSLRSILALPIYQEKGGMPRSEFSAWLSTNPDGKDFIDSEGEARVVDAAGCDYWIMQDGTHMINTKEYIKEKFGEQKPIGPKPGGV